MSKTRERPVTIGDDRKDYSMTRYQLLKAIRDLIYARWDSAIDSTWMPRQDGPYKELYVFMVDGRRFHITIKEDRWHE